MLPLTARIRTNDSFPFARPPPVAVRGGCRPYSNEPLLMPPKTGGKQGLCPLFWDPRTVRRYTRYTETHRQQQSLVECAIRLAQKIDRKFITVGKKRKNNHQPIHPCVKNARVQKKKRKKMKKKEVECRNPTGVT